MNRKLIIAAGLLLAVPALRVYAQDSDKEMAKPAAEAMADDNELPMLPPPGDMAENGKPGMPPGMDISAGPMTHGKGAKDMPGRGGKGARPGMMPSGPFGEMPKIEDLISDIRKVDSAFADKLEKMRKEQPFAFHASLRNAIPALFFAKMENDKDTLANAIKIFALETEIRELSAEYRIDKADKAGIKKQLEEKVSQLFDKKLAMDETRVTRLAKEVEDLKARNAKRKAGKTALVKDRVQEVLGEKETW